MSAEQAVAERTEARKEGSPMTSEESVMLELSKDQALVLFDWIKRFNESDDHEFEDQAEERTLWDLEARLERDLAEPFADNYGAFLTMARARVRDSE